MGLSEIVKYGRDACLSRWNIIIYSEPGVGKTYLAAQAPNTLILEIDLNGWIVLSHPSLKDKVRYYELRDFEKVVKFVRALSKDPLLQEIDTIVIDTISELQTLHRMSLLQGDFLLNKAWMFHEHLYAVNNFKILGLINEILALGKNTIFTCHMVENEQGKIRPALSPSLLKDVLALLDGAFYLTKENQTRKLQLEASGADIMTKSRFPTGTSIINPTFEKLLPILESTKEMKS